MFTFTLMRLALAFFTKLLFGLVLPSGCDLGEALTGEGEVGRMPAEVGCLRVAGLGFFSAGLPAMSNKFFKTVLLSLEELPLLVGLDWPEFPFGSTRILTPTLLLLTEAEGVGVGDFLDDVEAVVVGAGLLTGARLGGSRCLILFCCTFLFGDVVATIRPFLFINSDPISSAGLGRGVARCWACC